jgi:hypothetical protein
MPCIMPSVGTPAYRYALSWTPPYHKQIAWRIKIAGQWAINMLIGCRHRHITLPFQNRQTCLDCGAWRHYILDTLDADISLVKPIFIGRWKRPEIPETIPSRGKGAL